MRKATNEKNKEMVLLNMDKIYALSKEKGLSLAYLAELIDKSHSYLTDMKNSFNRKVPRTDEKILAVALGLKPGELIVPEIEAKGTVDTSGIENQLKNLDMSVNEFNNRLKAVEDEFSEILYKLDALFEAYMNKALLEEPEIKKAGEFLMNLLSGRAQGVGQIELWEKAREKNIAPASIEKARKGLPVLIRTVGTGSAQKTRWYIDR